jgi:outer membrane receptor for ferric coprogen and ferric-rhodotorulic acid
MPLTSDGGVRARVVGVYQDRDSFQDLYSNERKVFYGVVDADLSPDILLTVGVDYQDNKPSSNTWGSFPLYLADGSPANWSRSVTTSTDWAYWDRNKRTAFTELRYAFAADWSLRASLTWRRFEEDSTLFYMFGFPDPQTGEGLEPFAYRSDAEITERAVDLQATGIVNLFGRQHELVVGFNRSRVDNNGLEYGHGELAPTGNFFAWDGSYPEPEFGQEGSLVNAIDTWQNGLYAAGRFVLADPLKLIAGLRYSTWKSEGTYIYASDTDSSNFDLEEIIPYAGLVWDVSEQFSVFTSYTGIFKPQGSRDVRGALLDPIDGNSVEVGVKGEHLDGRLNTALTLFETQQSNVATAAVDPDTGEAILLPDGTQASRAIDGTQTRGFELEISGEIQQGWNASLGWSRYQLEDEEGRAVRTFVPRTLIRGFTNWSPSSLQQLTLGGGVNWQSKSSTFVGTPDGGTTLEQSDVTLLSVMARYQVTPTISVQFNSDNLLDEKYFVLDEFDNTYFGTPVNYSLSVNVKL